MYSNIVPCLIREIFYAPKWENNKTVSILVETALTHQNSSHYKLSIETYIKAQNILTKSKTLNISEVIFFRCSIGSVYESSGNDEFALREYLEAKRYSLKFLDLQNNPDQSIPLSCIGCIYFHLQQYELAEDYFLKVKEVREKLLGEDHVDTGLAYNNYAASLQLKDNIQESIELYEKASLIFNTKFGKNHPRTLIVSRNLMKVKRLLLNGFEFIIPKKLNKTIVIPLIGKEKKKKSKKKARKKEN